MFTGPVLVAAFVSLGVVAFALWLWVRLREVRHLPPRRIFSLVAFGGLASGVAHFIERWALDFADVSLTTAGAASGLAMILFCGPLEEGLKAGVVWPLYVARRMTGGRVGALYALVAAAGFSSVEVLLFVVQHGGTWLSLLRVTIAAPAHLFFAGLWGFMLGGGRRDRFFWISWIFAAGLHGVYDHIVFGRGPALLVIVVPMLVLMAVSVIVLLREPASNSSGRVTAYSLFERPSVSSVRGALSRRGRRLMLHWIVIGAFVNLGVTFLFLAASVYFGHQVGVDFSLADEAGFEGILPVALLGGALLAAFPVSAYMIARASGAESVLEPAWATGASIFAVIALFSVTEPTALVIAVGVAPVGFTLACAGAWFGLSRH
jgi:hypothetical protein